jgi:pseudouridine-5'-phosphate glycosidase
MKIVLGTEAAAAIKEKRPLVALESTVISHGLPFPQNLETARQMEEAVRQTGAVPATIALVKGVATVGLDEQQLEHFAGSNGILKASVRDLPIAAAAKKDGATTVATTMFIAHRTGIRVFATGGIGGVHRGNASDVSADLPILANTPMTTVCSGAKIVLDLEATREWLETHGICVMGWKTDEYPAFYTGSSGLDVDLRVNDETEAAAVVRARDEMSLKQAVLLTVPPPAQSAIPETELDIILTEALKNAETEGISGKLITPYLLSKMSRLSDGRTIGTNIALLLNNASIAGKLACKLGFGE